MTKPSATSTPPARPPPTPPLTTQQPRKGTNSTRTKTIVATVVGTLSILSPPTNGQLRRLRTREPNLLLLAPPRFHGFGRAFAANGRDAPRAKDPLRQWHSRRRRDRVSSRRREDRALSKEDRRNDGAADADDEREKTQKQTQKQTQTQTQKRNLQPLFADEDDGVSVTTSSQPQQSYDYDYVDGFHDYQYEYDFDYVIPEGTLPDDAVGIFDDPDHDFPDVPPGFPSTEEGEGEEEGVAIVSSPTFDFGFSIPEDNDGYFPPLDGDGNNDTPWEEGYPAEIAESSLLEEGGAFSMMVAVPTLSPTTFWAEDYFETTAIDFEEDEDFLGRMSLSMSFGMPNQDQNHDEDGEEVFEDYHHYYYSMSMSMPLTFEPSITPPATEPPSTPPTQSPVHPPSYPPSVSPTTESRTPFMGLSMDYDVSMSMDYEMSVGTASEDDGATGTTVDYDDGGSMSMSMSFGTPTTMPTKPSTSQTTPPPTLLVQDLPYVPTRPSDGDGDATNTGNGGLIPAEGSSTDAPTPTVGGTATGGGDESTPTFFPTTALPTESFGRAVPATGPSPPSSSSSLALSLSFG
ncbi:hypothetical protein ACHAXS_003566 [Conticribra weissflogii]